MKLGSARNRLPALLMLPVLILGCFGEPGSVHVSSIEFASYPEHTLVYLVSDRQMQYRTGRLVKPERFYLDLRNATIGPELKNRQIKVTDQFITAIRVAQSGPAGARVVFDLNSGVAEKVVALKNPPGLLIDLEKNSSNALLSETAAKGR